MYRVFWLLLLLSATVTVWKRQFRWLTFFLPAIAIWLLLTGRGSRMLGNELLTVMLVLSLLAAIIISMRLLTESPNAKRFILLGGIFFLLYITFTVFNFITQRYLLAALVWVIVFAAIWLDALIEKMSVYFYLPVVLLLGINVYKAYQWNTGLGDCNLQAFNAITVQKDVIDYLKRNRLYEESIGLGSFQLQIDMKKPAAGFVSPNSTFTNVSWDINDKTRVAVFDNIEPDSRHEQIKNNPDFSLVFQTVHGDAQAEVYIRKK
jgi:hypothetical protein